MPRWCVFRSRKTVSGGGENHQLDRQLAGQAEGEGEREGDEWQQDKLAGEADNFCFRREDDSAEIRRDQTEPHTEEHGEEGQRQSHFFEQLGWPPAKLSERPWEVDAGACSLASARSGRADSGG